MIGDLNLSRQQTKKPRKITQFTQIFGDGMFCLNRIYNIP